MRRRLQACFFLALVTYGSVGRAAPVSAEAPHQLEFQRASDALRVGLLGAGFVFVQYGVEAPTACLLCGVNALDLNVATWLGAAQPEPYEVLSNVLVDGGLVAGASASLLDHGDLGLWAQDVAIIGESMLASAIATTLVKRWSARVRPGVYFGDRRAEIPTEEAYQSFFSGHSSTIAALSASVVTLAYLRGYGYRHAALATGIGLTLAVGVLRVAAQRHWLTDVLVGWLAGAAFGVLVPLLLHPREQATLAAGHSESAAFPLLAVGL